MPGVVQLGIESETLNPAYDSTQILLKTYNPLEIYSIMIHTYHVCRERAAVEKI
jgi:hypothetical protein